MATKKFSLEGENFEISYELIENCSDFESGENSKNFNIVKKYENGKNSEILANGSREKLGEILILHGWGANKELMKTAFGSKFGGFRQIYLDLPGFGGSNLNIAIDSHFYAKIIKEFLKLGKFEPNIIIAHSFGGKIAVLLNPEILVLLSSAGIVTKKKLTTKAKIAIFKVLKLLGFAGFYRFFASKDVNRMNRTMYETFKKVVNENFAEIFAKFKGKTLIFWGKDDKATPIESGKKISSLIKNSQFFELDGDHFFFLKNSDFIEKTILQSYNG